MAERTVTLGLPEHTMALRRPFPDAARSQPPPERQRLPRLHPPAEHDPAPDPSTARHFEVRRLAAEVQIRVMRSESMGRAVAGLIRDTAWPKGRDEDVEYRRNLLRLGHYIGAAQDADREALALLHQLLEELHPPA